MANATLTAAVRLRWLRGRLWLFITCGSVTEVFPLNDPPPSAPTAPAPVPETVTAIAA